MKDNTTKSLAELFNLDIAVLEEQIKKDGDIYTAVATLTGIDRNIIKTLGWGTMYGISAKKLQEILSISEEPQE